MNNDTTPPMTCPAPCVRYHGTGEHFSPVPFDLIISGLLDRCLILEQEARDLRQLVEEVAL